MSEATQFTSGVIQPLTATILNGQTTSDAINTFATGITIIEMPAAFDGTQLTFQTSSDGVTFQDYYNINNVPVAVTCTAGRNYGLAAQDFYGVQWIKVVSNASETADREIKLIPKSI